MFVSPIQVITHLPIRSNARVADFGAGSGEYTTLLQDKISEDGAVYTFDILPDVVNRFHREHVTQKADNLFSLQTDLNQGIPLKDGLLQGAVVSNTLHAITEREVFLDELYRVLGPLGVVLFVDWTSSFNNMGPTEAQVIAPGESVRLFRSRGFMVGAMVPSGSHHYAFIATKI